MNTTRPGHRMTKTRPESREAAIGPEHCVTTIRSGRSPRAGAAPAFRPPARVLAAAIDVLAAAITALTVFAAAPAAAHEGHDHDAGPAMPLSASAPQRLPDGAILLPKASQRQLGVRTAIGAREAAPRAIELPGLVAMDPNAGGRVQPTIAGRIEPPAGGLPAIGQRVARGQVLAVVRAAADPIARSGQAAQLAELRAAHALAEKRATRLRGLSDTVPRKEIEAAESELASLGGRIRALAGGLEATERLAAPVAGVIAQASVVAGQVVDAREVLFEIVDPSRLRIEATGFDAALAADVAGASIAVGGKAVPLAFVGAGRVLREQAVPLVFRGEDAALSGLAVGQPVSVTVRTRSATQGVPLPAAALVRSASNEPIVWVKTAPERFEPKRVRAEPLDAARVLVTQGLEGGERVVVESAPLLNQVR